MRWYVGRKLFISFLQRYFKFNLPFITLDIILCNLILYQFSFSILQMISTLIFLSVSLVFSQQQRYPAPTTRDMMYWLSHYYLPSRQAINHHNNNYHHPDNCEDHPGYYHPFLRHFTLAKPNRQTFSQQVKMVCLSINFIIKLPAVYVWNQSSLILFYRRLKNRSMTMPLNPQTD